MTLSTRTVISEEYNEKPVMKEMLFQIVTVKARELEI